MWKNVELCTSAASNGSRVALSRHVLSCLFFAPPRVDERTFALVYSVIEMMEEYTNELEGSLNQKSGLGTVKSIANSELDVEPDDGKPSSSELASFSNRRMALMMMTCVGSRSGSSDCNLVDVVREATISVACEVVLMVVVPPTEPQYQQQEEERLETTVVGEVVVAVEAWNTVIILAMDRDTSKSSSGTSLLLAIARQVVTKVRNACSN